VRAGAIVRVGGVLSFLPTEAVRRFMYPPPISDVSGTGLTMALVDGQVLAVVCIGERGACLAVCHVGSELVGLLGAHPVDVGFFESEGAGVMYRGQKATPLDVAELVREAVLGSRERQEVEA